MKPLAYHCNRWMSILVIIILILPGEDNKGSNKSKNRPIIKESYHEFVDEIPKPAEGMEKIKGKLNYPRAAFLAGFEGDVIAKVYINESGEVDYVEFIKTLGRPFENSIEDVLYNTIFSPAIFNGNRVKSISVLTFKYEIRK